MGLRVSLSPTPYNPLLAVGDGDGGGSGGAVATAVGDLVDEGVNTAVGTVGAAWVKTAVCPTNSNKSASGVVKRRESRDRGWL